MNKFWRKMIALGTAAVMTAALMAGCGGNDSPSDDASAEDPGTADDGADQDADDSTSDEGEADDSADSGPSGDAVEVTLWHYFENEAKALDEMIAEYNSLQDEIYITATYVARDELMNQYTIGAVSGELPDIGMVDSPDMASYISLGVFEDITEQLEAWGELDNFYDGPLSSCMDNEGKIYGLPNNSNCLALLCNMDLLRAAGYEEGPETWEEFEEIAAATTDPDDNVFGYAMCLISNEEGMFQFMPWLYAAGGSVTDLTSDGSVRALSFLADMVDNGYLSKESVNWSQADAYNSFIAGKAAMVESGTWQIAVLDNDLEEAEADFEYKYYLLPKDETHATTIGGENFGVCAGSDATDACVEFLKWFHGAEKNGEWVTYAGKLVVREDADQYNALNDDERFALFSSAMDYSVARGPHESWPTISEAVYTAAQGAVIGEKTAAEALQEAAEVVNPILEETPIAE